MRTPKSSRLFARAQRILPGGVNSPVRAFKSVGGSPLFIRRALGARLVDVDGNELIDYVMSWGPLIHGHAPRGLVLALRDAVKDGTSYGAPSPLEVELGERVRRLMPSLERVRFVSSGTEAAMSAIRVARAATGRERIIKFEGCYHGHADPFLVQAGSGALTLGVPTSPGVTRAAVADTLVASYNDLESVHRLFDANRDQVAALIVEPIAGNMNCVPPAPGFLEGLREQCDKHGVVLIFDEVMTGFRVSLGGAQGYYGITPDLSTFGKIVGGGMPVGCFGGHLQFAISLIEQVLGFLRVTAHVPFISLLRGHDLLPGLLAQPLRGSQIGMTPRIDILPGVLCDSHTCEQQQGADDESGKSAEVHGQQYCHGCRIR